MADSSGIRFKTGNICRIYVKNFLTFNEVEVRPKPRLNLIYGRNGSGKSTILSAICLCLGGKAQVLGRSKEVFDYVKIGKTEAILEVEVFVLDQINAVITHKINSSARRCSWFIQGKEVTHAKAMARIKELNIQVDNLCQFLPQDRVVAFAKMNSQNLLMATQKAVGDPSLFNDHQQLCSSGKKLMTMQDRIKELQGDVAQIERRNARLKDVVDNLEVKQKLETEIEELKKQHAWDLYDLKRKIHQEHKEKLEEVLKELNEFKHRMNPTIEKTKKINAALSEVKKIVHSRTQLVRKSQLANENLKAQSNSMADKLKDAHRHFATQKAEEQERLAELKDYQRQLDVLQGQLQNLPGLDENEVTHRLEELTQMIKSSSQKVIQLQNDLSDITHVRDKKKGLIKTHMEELKALQDVKGQRMKLIRSFNKDVYKATQWLQDNRHCFKGIVYPPICAMLNVKNQHYARYVENRVMERDLVAFVCEDKDDVNSLKQEMDRQRLCINIVYANPDLLDQYKPNQPIQQLRKYGFETYMLDCLEGPPAILSFLCQNYGLHNVPIGTAGNYDAVPSNISVFYLAMHRYSRIVSRYDKQVSTSIFQVGAAKLLQIVLDQEKINELKAAIENLETQIQEVEEQQRSLRTKEDQLSKNLEVWRNEKRALSSRKEERRMLVQRINHKKNQISEHEANVIDLPAAKAAMISVVQNCTRKQVEVIEKIQANMKETGELICACLRADGKAKILNIELTSLENSARVWKEKMKHMQEKAEEMKHVLEKQKLEGRDALNNLKQLLGIVNIREITDEIRERFQNSSLEETESKLADKDAQLSCLITASANEMKEYQEGRKKLARQREILEDLERRVETHFIDLSEVKERWLTQLTRLVGDISERFSEFMERMGYAGEVSLIETEEDFENYGMAIKVKFRDEQRLQQLTAQQQSGGERAVSTALYLLALQSLTAAPFRCVDEINQGMDKVNERKILEMLMETEGSDDCSQYFFVTPKLLQNLNCKWEVNVMLMYNSPNTLTHRRFAVKRILKRKDDVDRRR